VAESASVYIPLYHDLVKPRPSVQGVLVPIHDGVPGEDAGEPQKAFSLAHFIPLLRDRIYVVSPFTRSYLVSWITVLDSVPELELITYLPEFLDGLLYVFSYCYYTLFISPCRKYLSDPTEDVKIATETLLADFLREIRDVTAVTRRTQEDSKLKQSVESLRRADDASEQLIDLSSEKSDSVINGEQHAFPSDSPKDTIPLEYRESGGSSFCFHYFGD
jgi:vacuole morphology and inheritance protein 14